MVLGRVGHFMKDMGGAVQNVAKAANYAANPTHVDDIAKGAINTGEFVAAHPGVVKDVGVAIAKDQLKPQNLAINAALIAATVATGGAAAPAWAARVGLSAKAVETGVGAVEAGRTVEAGVTAAKAADAAVSAGKAARATSKAVELGRAAEEVVEGGKTGSSFARGLEQVNEARRTLSPIAERTHAFRTAMGEKVLAGGESPLRQMTANLVQGTGGIGPTTRMAGQSENAYRAQQQVRHVKMARSAYGSAKAAPAVASAVADPQGYAMRQALNGVGGQQMGNTGQYQVAPGGRTVIPQVSANGVPMDPMERTALRAGQKLQNFGAGVAASNSLGGPNAFWKGPNREGFGGIKPGYDWRKFEQRNVNQVTRSGSFLEGGMMPGLSQPGTAPDEPPAAVSAAKPDGPVSPPPMVMKAAASPLYSSGTETSTTGARVMPKASGNNRGGKSDHSTFYGSGVSTEDVDFTIGNTPGWNADTTGTMTFTPLSQPKASGRKGGIGPMGLNRINESLADTAPVESPLVPPKQKKLQTIGV